MEEDTRTPEWSSEDRRGFFGVRSPSWKANQLDPMTAELLNSQCSVLRTNAEGEILCSKQEFVVRFESAQDDSFEDVPMTFSFQFSSIFDDTSCRTMFRALRARNNPDLWSGRLPILVTGKRRRALRAVFCGWLVLVQHQRVAYHTAHQQATSNKPSISLLSF